jgi:hypothetical protein
MKMKMKNQKPQVNSTSRQEVFFPVFPDTPTGQVKKVDYSHSARMALSIGRCPYCDTDETEAEGFFFGGSDDREGGFLDCEFCGVRIAWIDNPFEAEVQWYED